jgi:hypothetical protein
MRGIRSATYLPLQSANKVPFEGFRQDFHCGRWTMLAVDIAHFADVRRPVEVGEARAPARDRPKRRRTVTDRQFSRGLRG